MLALIRDDLTIRFVEVTKVRGALVGELLVVFVYLVLLVLFLLLALEEFLDTGQLLGTTEVPDARYSVLH